MIIFFNKNILSKMSLSEEEYFKRRQEFRAKVIQQELKEVEKLRKTVDKAFKNYDGSTRCIHLKDYLSDSVQEQFLKSDSKLYPNWTFKKFRFGFYICPEFVNEEEYI